MIEPRAVSFHDQLGDGGRQHGVDGLRHLDLHQRLRFGQAQSERGLTLAARQIADAGAHQFGDHRTVVQHQGQHHGPIGRAGQAREREPSPEEDHEQQHRHRTAELDDHGGNATYQRVRQQSAHAEHQAEHHGTHHGHDGGLDGHPQSGQVEIGPRFTFDGGLPQLPAELILAVRRVVQAHEDKHEHHREQNACDPVDDANGAPALGTGRVEQHGIRSIGHIRHLLTASLLDRYVVSMPMGMIRIT